MRRPGIITGFFSLIRRLLKPAGFVILFTAETLAAPLWFEPVRKELPGGSAIDLFVSGDEFFNWLHDKYGFPVGKGGDGYFYYMLQKGDEFELTGYKVGQTDPASVTGLKRLAIPSFVETKRESWQKGLDSLMSSKGQGAATKSKGLLNNMVIYIRFKGEPDFTVRRPVYDSRLNLLSGPSVRHYFSEVSYDQLDIVSYHLPGGVTSELCYTDQYTRSYYQPYDASSNPGGYKTDNERTQREHNLLANAAIWIDTYHDLPDNVDFDSDDDGDIDNVCFIVRGSSDGWSELLWPHRWVLYSVTAKIDGLRVRDYTFQLENVSVTTLSHEMFHVLGAPDLYHYDNSEKPVGPWDIMANGGGHMGAWMKYRYGKWLDQIPEISSSGTYTVRPLSESAGSCFILKSPYRTDQFFVIEYRRKEGFYESKIPASGIIITRIDLKYRGNAGGPPDEIYVFRKNGGPLLPGDLNAADFSSASGRTTFSDNSNPYAFFQEGGNTALNIRNIISLDDSMSFTVEMDKPVDVNISPVEDSGINLSWSGSWERDYLVAVSPLPGKFNPLPGKQYAPGDTIGKDGVIIQKSRNKYLYHDGLESDETYNYSIWTVTGNEPASYSEPARTSSKTGIFYVNSFPYLQAFDASPDGLPRGWKSSAGAAGWNYEKLDPFSMPNSVLIKPQTDNDLKFFTPGFELQSSATYMATYRYRNQDVNSPVTLVLSTGTSRNSEDIVSRSIVNKTNIRSGQYNIQRSVFRIPSSGTYYMAFSASGGGIIVDDFEIRTVPAGTTEHNKPAEFYPNPSRGKVIIPAGEPTEITVCNLNGRILYQTTIEGMQEIDLSRLGRGIYLLKFKNRSGNTSGRLVIL